MVEYEYKVEVINLCKNYGTLEVLKDCNFKIKNGEFVCVVGPTGCGKTTFLNILTRLTEETSGQILLDGEPADPRKHNLAFVFQEPSMIPWLTVERNIRFGLEIKKESKEHIRERVDTIISMMGMNKLRKHYSHELSASAEQKVVIGRAFAMNPDLLLMDEPYGQMDIKTRYYLEDEVIRLWKDLGSTIVFVTHNVEEAVYLAERVLVLSQKPASVKENIVIDLPRPRDITSKKFIEYRTHIVDMIKWW
ncbi:MAG TPA: ABC transporter ATP-binding protein [Desulfatiglandales bacterium]|nr:ABC transporter ATP-binding protein [Desulfatiglandales bacterium]